MLVTIRILQGIGIAIIYPAASALIMKWFPPSEKAYANTAFVTFAFIGTGVAFLFTSFLLSHGVSWQSALATPGAAALALVAIWLLLARRQTEWGSETQQSSEPERLKHGSLGTAIRMPVIWLLAGGLFATRWVHEMFLFFLPLFFQSIKGYSSSEAAQLASVLPLSGVAGILVFGVLARKPELRKLLLCASAALALMAIGPLILGNQSALKAGLILAGFGLSGLLPVHATYVMSLPRVTPSLIAAFFVVTNVVTHVAGFLSPIAVGKLSQTSVGLKNALALLSAVELFALLMFLLLPPITEKSMSNRVNQSREVPAS
jgi:MFS family permease